MIKIFSSHGKQGGSTEAFINLTNEFNKRGYECNFYTPHDYAEQKCNHIKLSDNGLDIKENDHVIIHYIKISQTNIKCKKMILSCHEQVGFKLNELNLFPFDKIHFVSKHQKEYHNINFPYFICENIYTKLQKNIPENKKIAGIIGAIYPLKRTHEAIMDALSDNMEKILLYGVIEDTNYFNSIIIPLIQRYNNKIIVMGHCDNKQKMYDSFTDLYHHSNSECLPTVLAEAKMTGKKIHIPNNRNYKNCKYEFNTDKIIKTWLKELCLC